MTENSDDKYDEYVKVLFAQIDSLFNELSKETPKDRELEIEIKGSEEIINGISFEAKTFDKNDFYELFDPDIEYLKNSTFFFSYNIELKNENDLETIKYWYGILKNQLKSNTNITLKNPEILFRRKGKKVSFDVFSKSPQPCFENIYHFKPLFLALKCGFDFNKTNEYMKDILKYLFDICSLNFSFKMKYNYKFFIAIILAVKDVIYQLGFSNENEKNAIEKLLIAFKLMISSLDKTEIKFNYDTQHLSELLNKEEYNKYKILIPKTYDFLYGMIKTFKTMGKFDGINLDDFSINFGYPMKKFGFHVSLKVSGLSYLFNS